MKPKLVSRKEFARLAAVSQAAVTNACKATLAPALVGRRIDATHAAAREYVARRRAVEEGAPDPLYNEALAHCIDSGAFTQVGLQRRFMIGYTRSKSIMDAFKTDGLVPAPRGNQRGRPSATPNKHPAAPHVRGTAARKEKEKRESTLDPDGVFEIPENILAFADMTLRDIIEKFGTDTMFKDYLAAVARIEDIQEKRIKSATREGALVSRELIQTAVIDVFNAAHLRILTDGAKSLVAGVLSKHASGASEAEIELYAADVLGSFIRPVKGKIERALRAP